MVSGLKMHVGKEFSTDATFINMQPAFLRKEILLDRGTWVEGNDRGIEGSVGQVCPETATSSFGSFEKISQDLCHMFVNLQLYMI